MISPNPNAKAMFDEAHQFLEKCGPDTEAMVLGSVLVKLHGALEQQIRHILLEGKTLSFTQCQEVKGESGYQRAGWLSLVKLLQSDFGLPRSQRSYLLDYNEIRNDIAHARPLKPGTLTLKNLQEYANFVEDCLQRNWTPVPSKVQPNATEAQTRPQPAPQPTPQPVASPASVPPSPVPANPVRSSAPPRSSEPPRSSVPHRIPSQIPTGTQWIVKNLTALGHAIGMAIVAQIAAGIGFWILEACHLIPKGSSSSLTQFVGGMAGAACFFERQARGLVSDSTEWSIVSLIGIGMVGVPALVMGWIGRAILPADNAFLILIGYLIVGAALGLAIGIAQYRVLRPSYPNIEAWIPANMLDWTICLGFAPLLRLLRPEVGTSFVALFVLPLMGFVLGKAVTGYQVRQLRMG